MVGTYGPLFARSLAIVALSLAAAIVLPTSLAAQQAQQAQPRKTEYRIGAGFTYQGADHGSIANDIGGHGQIGVTRRQSANLAIGGEAAYHGFVGQGCDAAETCSWGADWITYVGATALLGARPGGIPVYAIGGVGAYYGGQSSQSASLRPGGSVGLGLVLLRRAAAMLSVDVRYHRFTSDIHGTSYMLPATLSLTF